MFYFSAVLMCISQKMIKVCNNLKKLELVSKNLNIRRAIRDILTPFNI